MNKIFDKSRYWVKNKFIQQRKISFLHDFLICSKAIFQERFPRWLSGNEFACNVGHLGLIPGLGRSPGEGKGYPLQYSGLENSMDCIVHGVAKSQTGLRNFLFFFFWVVNTCLPMQKMCRCEFSPLSWENPMEEEMATHSSIFAFEIPWTEEPGRLQSMG